MLLYLVYTTFVDVLLWASVTETEKGTLNLSGQNSHKLNKNGVLQAMTHHFYEVSCAGKNNAWFKQGTINIFLCLIHVISYVLFNCYKFVT